MGARRIFRRKLSRPARLSFGLCRRPSRRGLRPPAVDYLWRGRPFLSLCLSLRESCLALHLLCFASWSSPLSQFLTSRISSAGVPPLSLLIVSRTRLAGHTRRFNVTRRADTAPTRSAAPCPPLRGRRRFPSANSRSSRRLRRITESER